jgi:hypothetical protein
MFDASVRQAGLLAGGALLGLAGTGCLTVAAIAALTLYVGLIWATLIVAIILLGFASLMISTALSQKRTIADDMEDAKSQMIAALSGAKDEAIARATQAPYNLLNDFVDQRPLVSMAAGVAAGFAVARDPDIVVSGMNKLVSRLLE